MLGDEAGSRDAGAGQPVPPPPPTSSPGGGVVAGPGGTMQEKYSQFYREYTVLLEYKQLPKHVPSGIYVLPSPDSLFVWHGVIFIRQGIYRRGIFKFEITIPETYPEMGPSIRFLSRVYHPMVNAEGRLELKQCFPTWTAHKDCIWHVLAYMKKIFYCIETASAQNSEAAQSFVMEPNVFKEKAEACVVESIEQVYINPEHSSLRFLPWDPQWSRLQDHLLKRNGADKEDEGLISWVSKGVSKIINIRY